MRFVAGNRRAKASRGGGLIQSGGRDSPQREGVPGTAAKVSQSVERAETANRQVVQERTDHQHRHARSRPRLQRGERVRPLRSLVVPPQRAQARHHQQGGLRGLVHRPGEHAPGIYDFREAIHKKENEVPHEDLL